jgi:hypothetical protein
LPLRQQPIDERFHGHMTAGDAANNALVLVGIRQ